MERIRARKRGRKSIYIHNDLANAAHHYKLSIDARVKANERNGIAFECMSCLILLAFTFEAELNFIGHKLIANWQERQSFNSKQTEVLGKLELRPDLTTRPFSAIVELKKFRDTLAHGKPVEIEYDEIVEGAADELDRDTNLKGDWEQYCTPDFVSRIYADMGEVRKRLFGASKIPEFNTRTSGVGGLVFIGRVSEG